MQFQMKKKVPAPKTKMADKARKALLTSSDIVQDSTKDKILNAAIKLFSLHGFDQVSLKKIADEVGITQGAIVQHFGNRRNIVLKVLTVVGQKNRLYVDSKLVFTDTPTQQLIQHQLSNYEWANRYPAEMQIILLSYYFGILDPDFSTFHVQRVAFASSRIERYFLAMSRHGEISLPAHSVKDLSDCIHGFIIGLILREMPKPKNERLSLIDAEKLITDFTTHILTGIKTPKKQTQK